VSSTRRRGRLPRSQLGQCRPDEDRPRLVLGPAGKPALLGHRLVHQPPLSVTASSQFRSSLLAHDNVVIGDDPTKVTFETRRIYNDETTGKTRGHNDAVRLSGRGTDRYVVSFTRTRDLTLSRMSTTSRVSSISLHGSRTSTARICDSRATSKCRIIVAVSCWRPIRTRRSGN